jgi:hypothetical protein
MIDGTAQTGQSRRSTFLALLPLWCVLVLAFLGDNFDPVTRNPPEMLGLPAGVILMAGAAALTALGFVAIRTSTSRARSVLAFIFLTVPATIFAVGGPAIILIVINLSPQTA